MKKHFLLILVYSICLPIVVEAHSGRLDASGCHNNRKTGGYHCHQGRKKPKKPPQIFSAKVTFVIDGDTINVLRGGKTITIRLAGIDSPEKNQPYGLTARQFTLNLVGDQIVKIEATNIDKYGRTVAEVFLANGRSLNQALIEAGLAWWSQKYSKNQNLGALEKTARAANTGLWESDNPLPPWQYRQKAQQNR